MILLLLAVHALGADVDAAGTPLLSWWDDPAPVVTGALHPDDIRTELGTLSPQVQSCYSAVQAHQPDTTGPLALVFTVEPDGSAANVQATAPAFSDAALLPCVQGAVGLARFPTAAAPTQVHWVMQLGASMPEGIGGLIGTRGDASNTPGSPVILGALDKSKIDAVIKSNMNKIRACYQQELSKDRTLAGKITEKFVIARNGTVSSALTKNTTMNNAAVEGCINAAFMKFKFPKPTGGGIVIVSYPFIFVPG